VRDSANHVFYGQPVSYKTHLELKYFQWVNRFRPDPVRELLAKLIEHLLRDDFSDADIRAAHTYECLTAISDEAIINAIQAFSHQPAPLHYSFSDRLKSPLAGIMLSVPFFTALGFMHASRHLVKDFRIDNSSAFHSPRPKKVLWFSDDTAICEWVNGLYDSDIVFISHQPLPNILLEKQLLLPIIGKLSTSEDADTTIPIPSLLQSLEQLADLRPDEIIISTAGPVGLMGLLLSRLLKVSSVGMPRGRSLPGQREAFKDPRMAEMVEPFTTWFFGQLDQVIETQADCFPPEHVLPIQSTIFEPV